MSDNLGQARDRHTGQTQSAILQRDTGMSKVLVQIKEIHLQGLCINRENQNKTNSNPVVPSRNTTSNRVCLSFPACGYPFGISETLGKRAPHVSVPALPGIRRRPLNTCGANRGMNGPSGESPGVTSPDTPPGEPGARRSALHLTAPRPLGLGPPQAPARPRGGVRAAPGDRLINKRGSGSPPPSIIHSPRAAG